MTMQAGDFTSLAENYAKYRPGYSEAVLKALLDYTEARRPGFQAVDVGAGTGLWTKMLADAGLKMWAVEPNDSMREQGIQYTQGSSVSWRAGSAEQTGLAEASVDWLTMASSFHWADLEKALAEFHRVIRPYGYLTVLWNPRNIEGNPLHEQIENLLYSMIPDLKRVSSGASKHARNYYQELVSTNQFEDVVFFEALHQIEMSKERYLGAWRSVNDVQRQAGPELFEKVMDAIAEVIAPLDSVGVPYKTRAWTARRKA